MPRESSKCRKWEKDRRDRLKEGFTELAKVLPCYDPSINICKIDILHKATSNIQELHERIKKLLLPNSENAEKKTVREDIIKKLQNRVKKLLVRNEQLSNILKDAGISVPSSCGTIKKIKKDLLWSRRISPEQAEILQKKELKKENISSKVAQSKKKKYKNFNPNTCVATKHRIVNLKKCEARPTTSRKKNNGNKVPTSNCLIVLSQPPTIRNNISQPYYLIKNQAVASPRVVNKTGLKGLGQISNPIVVASKSSILPTFPPTAPTLSSLGPGTLILTNGTLVPILNQPQPLLQTSPVVTKSVAHSNTNVIVLPTTVDSIVNNQKKIVANIRPLIKPKHCLTRTTQVNKVPIPALTSRYANNYILLNETSSNKSNVQNQKLKNIKSNKNSTKAVVNQIASKRKPEAKSEPAKKIKISLKSQENNDKKQTSDIDNLSIACTVTESRQEVKSNNTNSNDSESKMVEINNSPILEKDKNSCKTDVNVETVIQEEENKITPKVMENNNISDCVTSEIVNSLTCTVTTTENIMQLEKGANNFKELQNKSKSNINESFVMVATTVCSTVTQTTITTTSTAPNNDMKTLELNLPHSELSNDIFASLQVPPGCQNPESTSPTAAFLLAFPLVSSGIKVTEVIDEDNSQSQRGTPTLLQIGTMDLTKPTHSQSDSISSNFINLDTISFFSSKDCDGFYSTPNVINKSIKTTLPTTLSESNKNENTMIKPIYATMKSPNLPKCTAKPIKDTSSYGGPSDISKVHMNLNSLERRNSHPQTSNVESHPQSTQSISKCAKSNYLHNSSKPANQVPKILDQKPQYQMTYPNSACNFNCTDSSKIFPTCSYVNINKSYNTPLYTNSNNYNYGYNYHSETNFNQSYYKTIPKHENKSYYPLSYPEYHKTETPSLPGRYYGNAISCQKDKKSNPSVKVKTSQSKVPINWMTTPDNRLQTSDCFLTPFSKNEFAQTYPFNSCVTSASTYFNTASADNGNVTNILEAKKNLELPIVPINSNTHQRTDIEEKQFSWSPTKLPHFLEPAPSFVSSTLPTLVGDLALGNHPLPFGEQKCDFKYAKDNKDAKRVNRVFPYENQTNFLSVSQLVDHNKPDNNSSRSCARNNGNKSKSGAASKCKKIKKQENKDITSCDVNVEKINHTRSVDNYGILENNELLTEHKKGNLAKISASSYSAEALIGNQITDESTSRRYPQSSNKSLGVSSFLTENIISYFPSTDLSQENYMPQNQNYQISNFSHNLSTSSQNNSYQANNFIYTASTITSSYLSTNNFETENHDYSIPDNLGMIPNPNKDNKPYNHKNCSKQSNKDGRMNHNTIYLNNSKRPKKMQSNDNINGLTGFDFPLFPISGSTNSPLLPDDFHTHTNFLPPTTPYPCKNSLYPKQPNDICNLLPTSSVPITRSNIHHPEISPSINSVGTSLTNFNLSTIFPEINKGPMTDIYSDVRPH